MLKLFNIILILSLFANINFLNGWNKRLKKVSKVKRHNRVLFRKMQYMLEELSIFEKDLCRAIEQIDNKEKFKKEIKEYILDQKSKRKLIKVEMAKYRLNEWSDICRCNTCKLLFYTKKKFEELIYEWRKTGINTKFKWLDQQKTNIKNKEDFTLLEETRNRGLKLLATFNKVKMVYSDLKIKADQVCIN